MSLVLRPQELLRRDSSAEPLPQLAQLCERMVDGWCAQLPALLRESLSRIVKLEDWVPVAEDAPGSVTASAIDVFVELDRLVQVTAM